MKNLKSIFFSLFVITFSLFFVLIINTSAFSVDTCVDCHKDEKFRVQIKGLFDYYQNWKGSDHDEAEISCQDCHGGDSTKAKKEQAHEKNLSPYNESSMVFYKNIPETCGKCHEDVYKNFIESKHYKALEKAAKGPICITCHGNPLMNVYHTSIVLSTCKSCHNLQSKNHPEVYGIAENILHRLNVCRGLLKWTSRHFDEINMPARLNKVNALYQNISDSWHQFNFTNTDRDSKELLSELRAIFSETHKWKKKNN
ncbi:MAG: hypothetical protein KAJ10_08025 [Thermodesulfovibrionia bacterium]|nr:hypothetical protein [Thermodesulfovibrionia bacterium]